MNSKKRELQKPPCARNPDAWEMLRVWGNGHGVEICVNPMFGEPGSWGVLLVDIARHAAKAEAKFHGSNEAEIFARIWQFAQAEWGNPTDIAGEIKTV
jgi:hypothetical protein